MSSLEKAESKKYGDFRDELFESGFVVVKGVISPERASYYRQKAIQCLQSFTPKFDINNPNTWVEENMPKMERNMITRYAVSHEKFMWDARQEPGVLKAFTTLWGTDELLASFDALNITLPYRKHGKSRPEFAPWPHIDQSPMLKGLCCVQGAINMSPAGPEEGSLVVYPKSHSYMDEFFDTHSDKSKWQRKNSFMFNDEHQKIFEEKGFKPFKVECQPGDLLLWDSRTMHYATEPSAKSDVIRVIIYACFTPAKWASEEVIQERVDCVKTWKRTSHWPHENINPWDQIVYRADGKPCPFTRLEPVEKPDFNRQFKRFVGIERY